MRPKHQKRVQDRADELQEYTSLSEREAFVYAAREEPYDLEHGVVASELGIDESTSQEYYRRAQQKVLETKRNHYLLVEGNDGPRTASEGIPLLTTDIDELTIEEIQTEIDQCQWWYDHGFTQIGVDLKDYIDRLEEAFLEKIDEKITEASEDGERLVVYNTEAEQKVELSIENNRYVIYYPDGDRTPLSVNELLRDLKQGKIEMNT